MFSYKLDYETAGYWDGNIEKQTWATKNANTNALETRSYLYNYDAPSRLKYATYTGIGTENFSIPNMSYVKNGNITNLQRNGLNGSSAQLIDNLTYNYTGNRLNYVNDAVSGNVDVGDFRNNNTGNDDYTYWNDGSLKSDKNKGVSFIEYDSFLRKVKQITFSNGNWIKFYYDGAGRLLKRVNSNGDYWDYVGNMIYKNGQPYQMSIPEGRAVWNGTGWEYEFDYRDIYGNLRVSFRGTNDQLTKTQSADYDALGFEYNKLSQTKTNFYKYQNQERVEDFGLNIDFFKYRPSDNQTGRFWQIDPLASQYPYNSPYAFQENKFGLGVELEGKELENFVSQFKNPSDLPIKTPDLAKSEMQIYSTTVSDSKKSFSEMKDSFMKNPEQLLSNSKAEFHAPENSKGEQTGLQKGNTIEIEIDGPQNDSYVKVHSVQNTENKVSATFVTLEGHVEKGVINFSIQDNGKNGMTFTIGSMSQLDIGVANIIGALGEFSKNSQRESWKEVLSNFVNTTGGKEEKRVIK